MKRIVDTACNHWMIHIDTGKESGFVPQIELILILSDKEYTADKKGNLAKKDALETVRLTAGPVELAQMAKDILAYIEASAKLYEGHEHQKVTHDIKEGTA